MASVPNGALQLISAYNSSGEESEDEVPGPRVSVKRTLSGSDSSGNANKRHATKDSEKRLPPPSALANLFVNNSVQDVHKDDADDHEGRIRSFPHERGNWASYAFVAVDPSNSLQSFIDVVLETCDPSLKLQRSENLHISLTRTVILKHHWIDSLASSIKKVASTFLRFPICLGEAKVYRNEELTRTFIGIEVTAGQEKLFQVTQRLDEALADFKLPSFYEEASFHLSIASCLGDQRDKISAQLPRLQSVLNMFIHAEPVEWSLLVDKLNFRTGNKYFVYNLLT